MSEIESQAGQSSGVGCACGWPLDPCNPKFAKTCDRERAEREQQTPLPELEVAFNSFLDRTTFPGEPDWGALRSGFVAGWRAAKGQA